MYHKNFIFQDIYIIFELNVSLVKTYLVMFFVFSLSISCFSNKAIPRTYQSPLVHVSNVIYKIHVSNKGYKISDIVYQISYLILHFRYLI